MISARSLLKGLRGGSRAVSRETKAGIPLLAVTPKDNGRIAYPKDPLDLLLAREKPLIDALQDALDLELKDQQRMLTPVLNRYGGFVHLLPASEAHHHAGMGGLLHHGLEVALWAVKASYDVVEAVDGPPHQHRHRARTWRLTIALAGLLHDIGKPVADLIVTDASGHLRWNPYEKSLLDWADQHALTAYYPSWRPNRSLRHRFFSLYVMGQLLPKAVLESLGQEGPELLEGLMKALTGTAEDHPMARLVHEADVKSAGNDLKSPYRQLDRALGIPIEHYLIHAINVLLERGRFTINQPGAILWILEDGHYLVWPQALSFMLEVIQEESIPGIPRDPVVLTSILVERGIAKERVLSDEMKVSTWPMQPACLLTPLSMLKLKEDLALFRETFRTPMAARLVVPDISPPKTTRAPKGIDDHGETIRSGEDHAPIEGSMPDRSRSTRIKNALLETQRRVGSTRSPESQPALFFDEGDIIALKGDPLRFDLLKRLLDPRLKAFFEWDQGHLLFPPLKIARCLDMSAHALQARLDHAGWLCDEPGVAPPKRPPSGSSKILKLKEPISQLIHRALQSEEVLKTVIDAP